MRKKIILTILIVIIVAIGILYYCQKDNNNQSTIKPSDIIANIQPHEESFAIFDKNQVDGNVSKFVFKESDGGCVYSLSQEIFLLTENSDEERVICYLDCETEEKCKPIAITTTGYMIFENEQGKRFAVQMEKSTMEQLIEPKPSIALDDLAEQDKNSLFELIEA